MYRVLIRDLDKNEVALLKDFDAFVLGAVRDDELTTAVGANPKSTTDTCRVFNAAIKAMSEKIADNPGLLLGMAMLSPTNDEKWEKNDEDD